jgi:hypothetical protein
MRGAIVGLVLLLAACASSSTPVADTSGSPSVAEVSVAPSPAQSSSSPSPNPTPADNLAIVAAQIYPLESGQYVTCDSGHGGPTRYANCPVTPRLMNRLLTVNTGPGAPEPLGGGQDPVWQSETITTDASGLAAVAHVVLSNPGSPPNRYDLVMVSSASGLLVDDIYCTGTDRATSSIYVDGWSTREAC